MNPELLRNIWLELTPQRLVIMAGGLAVAFFVAALGVVADGPFAAARWLYLLIVVVFGTRAAALAVVGEIRDRTWDSQRLSALEPAAMTFGKLFGSTIYSWSGGLLCLAAFAIAASAREGVQAAAIETLFYFLLGIAAQASAFLASLAAVRRREVFSSFAGLLFQLVGIAVGALGVALWSAFAISGANALHWWGEPVDFQTFLIASLAALASWVLVGCYREMRRELQYQNGPSVWLAFLAFLGAYVAGFGGLVANISFLPALDLTAQRFALVLGAFIVSSYAMLLLEPKDRARYRRVLGATASGSGSALDSWMLSYAASIAVGLALAIYCVRIEGATIVVPAVIASLLGFLTRDIAIFVLVHASSRRRSGDGTAIAALLVLYVLLPAILAGLHLNNALFVFYPLTTSPPWLGAAAAWAQGAAVAVIGLTRLSLREKAPPRPVTSAPASAPNS